MTDFFERIYELTVQLKGGPLTEYEKGQIREVFDRTKGNALERTYAAMAEVLNTDPSIIGRRIQSLERAEAPELVAEIEKAAREENPGSHPVS
ncbi:MAG: hypothetical protein C4576_03850 [Desulfobacteraceae bacterium]|nr:MAG: hypothetical protein C4576_03850 [Desulfobacteraceae bacterium]